MELLILHLNLYKFHHMYIMHRLSSNRPQMHIFLIFVTKTGIFATYAIVFMALNLICYVLHKPLLFPLLAIISPSPQTAFTP